MKSAVVNGPLSGELELLTGFRWSGGLVTSCYLNLDGRQWPNSAAVMTELNAMISAAREDLERRDVSGEAKVSVRQDLERLEQWVMEHLHKRSEAKTLAWFSCSRKDILVWRFLPVGLPNRIVLAEDFDEVPLVGLVRSVPRIGLVLVDHAVARFFHADISQIREILRDEAWFQPKVRIPDAFAERRLQNRREHLLHRHINETVLRLERAARRFEWSVLLVSGEDRAVSLLEDRLTGDLRRLTRKRVHVPVKADEPAVKAALKEEMDRLRAEQFESHWAQLRESTVPHLRAAGIEAVCRAACLDAVQVLLLEVAPLRPGRICKRCGWLGLRESTCPICGSGTDHTPHIYDNLADAVLAAGGDVLYSEKEVLPADVEHVAARLRFSVTGAI